MHVVIAHYNENLDWIRNLDVSYTIISRGGIPPETAPNKGREAGSYLEYIVKNYDSLEDITVFVHGHRSDWHHPENMDEKLRRLTIETEYKNINLYGINYLRNALHDMNATRAGIQAVADILGTPIVPEELGYKCSAQFYVSKRLIHRHSKEIYQRLYEYLMQTSLPGYWSGRVFEYTWHFIFTGNHIDTV